MADESNAEIVEATTPVEIAPPKKRRGPQPKKVVAAATGETTAAEVATAVTGRKKRASAPTDEAPTGRGIAKTKAKKVAADAGEKLTAKQVTPAPAAVLDGIADLLQLEEENARLRKALAEKLRAENADLRKRLGLA